MTLAEGNAGTTDFIFTVSLDASDPDDDILIDFTTTDGTAVQPGDYTTNAGTLTFLAGTATLTQQITVSVNGDTTPEADETFTVDLSLNAGNSGSAVFADNQGLGTITNDDNANISIDDVTLAEGNAGTTDFIFTVSLDASDPDDDILIDFTTTDGTAVQPGDYTTNAGTLTFLAGTATLTQQITVSVNGDTTPEADETFTVDLSLNAGNSGSAVFADNQGLGTITNDDNANISIDDVTLAEGNAGTTDFIFTVSLDASDPDDDILIDFTTTDGTAVQPGDYTTNAGTLTFLAGTATLTQQITVSVNGDTTPEADETFTVDLSLNAGNSGSAVFADNQGLGTITNDDAASVTIEDVTVTEGVGLLFTVTLDNAVGVAFSVDVNFTDVTATGGAPPLVAPEDYDNTPVTLNFVGNAGETQQFTVATLDDAVIEVAETFTVTLTSSNALIDDTDIATGTINDNDSFISINDVTLLEGNAGLTAYQFTVSVDGGGNALSDIDFVFETADGTATLADNDYVQVIGGAGTITAGTSSTTITVNVNGDTTVEPNETFLVNLSAPVNASINDGQGVGTINNDDGDVISINDVTLVEGNAGLTAYQFTISVDGGGNAASNIDFNFSTADNTATAVDNDYVPVVAGAGTITAGTPSTTVTVNVNGDTVVEVDETFFLNVSAPVNATINDGQGLGTITNDDSAFFTIDDVNVVEGNAGTVAANFTVTLTGNVSGGVSVDYQTADNTATVADSDYVAAGPTTLNFVGTSGETQNVAITVNGDVNVEPNETFFVNLLNISNIVVAADPGNDLQGIGTITNDDGDVISISDVSIAEGDAGATNFIFTVSIDGGGNAANNITFNYDTLDDTATVADNDYAPVVAGVGNIAIGTPSTNITVVVNGDTVIEPNENFLVDLSNAVNASINDSQAQATISNDDIDSDGDGASDGLEGTAADRDGDGILNHQDFDPTGYFYCTDNGNIIPGGSVTVTGPGVVTLFDNGSSGFYRFITDGTLGDYVITITPPPGATLSPVPADSGTLVTAAVPDPLVIGSGEFASSGVLADFTAAANPYFTTINYNGADPSFIFNNNIPLSNCLALNSQILLTKTAAPTEVVIGDLVQYSVIAENTAGVAFADLDLVDNIPGGFSYVDDSAQLLRPGLDGEFDTADDIVETVVVSGGDPITFNDIDLAGNERVMVRYYLRVTSGVVEGEYTNTVQGFSNIGVGVTNTASATVVVTQDPILQKTTIIGKVFNDRDSDGWQDSAHATKVKIKSEYFGWDSHAIGIITGRTSELDALEDHSIEVRMPINFEGDNSFHVVTAEGTVIKVDNNGELVEEHVGKKAKGLTAQDLVVTTERQGDELVITITNHGIHEIGIPGVRLATVEGLIVETDQYGRYHLADIDGGRWERGRNFIIKVDPATLPDDSEFTTENPRVLRITQGLMSKFNFGVRLPPQNVPTVKTGYGVSKRVEREQEVVETHEINDVINPIHYGSGEAQITEAQLKRLQEVINELEDKENVRVRIVGHSDPALLSDQLKALYEDNYGLSMARAEDVAGQIQSVLKLDEDEIVVEGKGPDMQVASNVTPSGMARNRRVEVQVLYDEKVVKKVIDVDYVPVANAAVHRKVALPNGGAIWAVEDPAIIDPRLNVAALGSVVLEKNKIKQPVSFQIYSNYAAFIDRWEIEIYSANDRDLVTPIDILSGKVINLAETIEWDPNSVDIKYFEIGQSLTYVLKAYDQEGRMDETAPQSLAVTEENLNNLELRFAREQEDQTEVANSIYGESSLIRQTIPISGSRVRVNGINVGEGYALTINGETVVLDEEGKFVVEQHLPVGKHKIVVNVSDGANLDFDRELEVDVSGKYMFMVGIANLTVGENDVSGSVEPLGEDDHFDEEVFVDGRVAFYLKGKVKGKYLVTAQLDTTEDELHKLHDRLEEEDPTEVFRRLDPDQTYAVYGDDSTTIDDTDSQGAFYVRVDWDKSRALWGNYNTDLTGTEFAQYNRSLYGAKLEHRNVDTTSFGEHKHEIHAFASEAQTAAAHNEFTATGGSLYYLRDTDVVQGSEKIWVEVRRRDTEQVVENITLEHGRDYDIDYIQGRIILTRPLTQVQLGSGPAIIKTTPLEGDDVFLLVDYEYRPDAFSADDITTGGRGKAWLGEYVAVGGTYVNEEREGTDYELHGADVTLRAGKGTYVKLEYAESDSSQASNSFASTNGGISFNTLNTNAPSVDGDAVGVEARVNFAEISNDQEGYITAWWKDRDAGFSSTARLDDGIETTDTGFEALWQATEHLELGARATQLDKKTQNEFTTFSVIGNYDITNKLNIGAEIRHEDDEDDSGFGLDSEATLGGAAVRYNLNEQTSVFVSGQTVIDDKGDYEDNDLVTVGIEKQVSDTLALKGEVATGDRGDAVVAGFEYDVTPNLNISLDAGFGSGAVNQVGTNYTTANGLELYGGYAADPDRTDSGESMFTFGTRKRYGNGLSMYSESQFGEGEEEQSIGRTYGLDFDLSDQWRLSASIQTNDVDQDAGDIDRRAATIGASYRSDDLRYSSVLEYRVDDNEVSNVDATQWLTTNIIEWQQSESLRWLGKLDLSTTHSEANKSDEGKYVELDLGFAYRPAFNDRLNILGKYTFLYDLATTGQDTSFGDQRSHIVSIEGIYDFTQKWELGAKLAYRTGDIRLTRGAGPWFETGAHLAVARARYHMLKKWDALFEYRWLETEEQDDSKQGVLLGVYRHIGNNLKVGAGYNFTDFSDDLTDNDYESNGWFFDVTGKY